MAKEKQPPIVCSNCNKPFSETDKPSFKGELQTPNLDIKINICTPCLSRPYIKNDRLIQKAYRILGEQITNQKQ